jgi:N-acetylmuramoyl-L-alanine amidase
MQCNNWRQTRRALKVVLVALLALPFISAQTPAPSPPPPTPPPASQPPPNQLPPVQPVPAQPTLLIMIDPAHGGSESGAVLNPAILEKDVTLGFAQRLLQQLSGRGIQAQLVRNGDTTLSTDQRALTVNSAHPALYIGIHATSQGSGVRFYTAMLPVGGDDHGPFHDWQTAQSASLARSRSIQEQLAASVQRMGVPIRSLSAPLRPLSNVIVPALTIEIAPTAGDVSQLTSADFQQMIAVNTANALASIRPTLESAP